MSHTHTHKGPSSLGHRCTRAPSDPMLAAARCLTWLGHRRTRPPSPSSPSVVNARSTKSSSSPSVIDARKKHEIAKRHKLDEHCAGKRIRERKEKMMHSYLNRNVNIVPPYGSSLSSMTHHASSKKKNSIEVSTWDGSMQQLMDETNQVLNKIAINLDLMKLQDNIDLFYHTRNSILSILSSMSSMPGIMRQMPPLPITVNDELLCSIFPFTSQTYMCGSHGGHNVKQELSRSNML